jgi:uncharacterized 2Fe-2S/4Fe-4S cluster protein (DUF4445 family)
MALIVFLPSGKRVEVEDGVTILSAAQKVGEGIRSLCGGKGSCGKCKVVVQKGNVEIVSEEAHGKFIRGDEVERGYYLACQTRVFGEVEVYIPPESRLEKQQILNEFVVTERELNPLVRKEFHRDVFLPEVLSQKGYTLRCDPEIEEGDLTLILRDREVIGVEPGELDTFFGLAVDIGTTTIVASLIDLTTGAVVNVASDYNGQIIYGEEVLSRVEFARSEKNGVKILQEAVVTSINNLIKRLVEDYSDPNRIYDVVAAGNTIMTHFFLGKDVEYLFSSPNPKVDKVGYSANASELGLNVNENALVFCLPAVGRFIGGDIVGDILASQIVDSAEISLMVDLGTNGEIVLGSEGWAIATSVASGPAFEGYEIKHGSRAVEGAIDGVKINSYDAEPEISVIGDVKPRSICGSGLIDLLAELFKNGIVDFQGNLDPKNPRVKKIEGELSYIVVDAEKSSSGREIVLTQRDIETLIKSKAAVCAGISVLMKKAGMVSEQVDNFYIAGAFGYYINYENAVTIGMFPEMPAAKVRQIGNGSLAGAYLTLTSVKKRKLAETMAKIVTYFDLSTDADFVEEYTAAMALPGKPELFPSIYSKYV